MSPERGEAVEQLEAMEHVVTEQEAAEIAAAAAFDQASARLAEVHTRVVVGRQQVAEARARVSVAFNLPGAFIYEMFANAGFVEDSVSTEGAM